jgi:F420-dependent oxidoreductase-like protein
MDKRIRFGVQLPQEGVEWDVLKGHTLEAERLGYDHAWQVDHLVTLALPRGHAQPDCWTLLAGLAEATHRIRIGAMVTCYAFRNPALLANMAATVDRISRGRLEFAVGAGWYAPEFEAYGYEFHSPGVRLAQLEEAIRIYQALWSGERVRFEGQYYRVKDLSDCPRPWQEPWPRFWIGGAGERKTLRLVARYADVWNAPALSPEECARKIGIIREHCAEVGRDPDTLTFTWWGSTYIDEDRERVRRRLRTRAEQGGQPSEVIGTSTLAGTPDEVAATIRRYLDAGVTEFACLFGRVSDLRSTRLFAETIFPRFDHNPPE